MVVPALNSSLRAAKHSAFCNAPVSMYYLACHSGADAAGLVFWLLPAYIAACICSPRSMREVVDVSRGAGHLKAWKYVMMPGWVAL